MKKYQEILLKKLIDDGWEIISQEESSDWWLDEQWTIKSIRANWGLELTINFLVDPQYDGNSDKKSSAVWAISLTINIPTNRVDAENGISLMAISKGKFDENISFFVKEINDFRHSN